MMLRVPRRRPDPPGPHHAISAATIAPTASGAEEFGCGEPPLTATVARAALNTAQIPTTNGRIALTTVASAPTTRCQGLATTASGMSDRRRPRWWRRSTSEVTDRSAVRAAHDQSTVTATATTGKPAAA